jgi:hypothetical protein
MSFTYHHLDAQNVGGVGGPLSAGTGPSTAAVSAGGPPPLMDDDIIGVIKIKDGLFICDEFGAQVRILTTYIKDCKPECI